MTNYYFYIVCFLKEREKEYILLSSNNKITANRVECSQLFDLLQLWSKDIVLWAPTDVICLCCHNTPYVGVIDALSILS